MDNILWHASRLWKAVTELHDEGWIHRDLKADQILTDKSGSYSVLADVGRIQHAGPDGSFKHLNFKDPCPKEPAPEILKGCQGAPPERACGYATDVYNFGQILYQLAAGPDSKGRISYIWQLDKNHFPNNEFPIDLTRNRHLTPADRGLLTGMIENLTQLNVVKRRAYFQKPLEELFDQRAPTSPP